MPKPHLNLFKFDESYASEWNAFIDLFPKDEELGQFVIHAEEFGLHPEQFAI